MTYVDRTLSLKVAKDPVLQIRPEAVTDSVVYVESDLFHPDHLYFQLFLVAGEELSSRIASLVERHHNDQAVFFYCDDPIAHTWISPAWDRFLPAGVFDSEAEAKELAARLNLAPRIIPYDPDKDEANRVAYLKSMLTPFVGDPRARERIAHEEPDLFRFLERRPAYWKLLSDLESNLGSRDSSH